MEKKFKFSDKKITQGLFIFCIGLVLTLALVGDKGFLQLYRLEQKEARLVEELVVLKEKREIWIKKIQSIKKSRTYLETYAREQLGMVRPNELIIRFGKQDETQPGK